jgi:pSer/pThr/pTyr-binding forkhead associated (FHA) protein
MERGSSTEAQSTGPRLLLDEREWILRPGENVLGRDRLAAIRIEAAGVSRQHARVVVEGDRSILEDLGSKNGTFACGERLESPRLLNDGDTISLGRRVRLVFRRTLDDRTETELATAASPARAMFKREGELWLVAFEGKSARLPDVKGFRDLARLLGSPGIETHCLELADRPAETAAPGHVLDAQAKREIQLRVRDLQHEIDRADASHDAVRAGQARDELDRIAEVMAGALGLGGRSRALGSPAERARSAVTWRIRNAIRKIGASHPRLGRHLENAVRTGVFCVYQPEAPVDWSL